MRERLKRELPFTLHCHPFPFGEGIFHDRYGNFIVGPPLEHMDRATFVRILAHEEAHVASIKTQLGLCLLELGFKLIYPAIANIAEEKIQTKVPSFEGSFEGLSYLRKVCKILDRIHNSTALIEEVYGLTLSVAAFEHHAKKGHLWVTEFDVDGEKEKALGELEKSFSQFNVRSLYSRFKAIFDKSDFLGGLVVLYALSASFPNMDPEGLALHTESWDSPTHRVIRALNAAERVPYVIGDSRNAEMFELLARELPDLLSALGVRSPMELLEDRSLPNTNNPTRTDQEIEHSIDEGLPEYVRVMAFYTEKFTDVLFQKQGSRFFITPDFYIESYNDGSYNVRTFMDEEENYKFMPILIMEWLRQQMCKGKGLEEFFEFFDIEEEYDGIDEHRELSKDLTAKIWEVTELDPRARGIKNEKREPRYFWEKPSCIT